MSFIKDIIRKFRVHSIRALISCKPSIALPDVALVFAPHPDDEVFGCCGLMQRMLAQGKRVELIIMTGGEKSHVNCCDIKEEVLITERRRLTCNASAIYGLKEEHIHFLNYPDGNVQVSNENTNVLMLLLSKINKTISSEKISVFYPHQLGEGWSDHIHTSDIAKQLCTNIFPDAKQYEYCVWFWFYNCWKICWKHAFVLKMSNEEHSRKLHAIDAYIEPKASCGNPLSGILPPIFLRANKWNRELFFSANE